jgi:hypothetical protein
MQLKSADEGLLAVPLVVRPACNQVDTGMVALLAGGDNLHIRMDPDTGAVYRSSIRWDRSEDRGSEVGDRCFPTVEAAGIRLNWLGRRNSRLLLSDQVEDSLVH